MLYHEGSRFLQDRFDTRRLADRQEERIVVSSIDDEDRRFIEACDMFFLATVDERGFPNCSYKGGDPGFVRVIDERTIAFPNYDGNGMYISMGNIRQTMQVGMLFIDFYSPRRLRVNGQATVDFDDALTSSYPEAQFVARVKVREVFGNCPRYIHRMQLVERSKYVPCANRATPVPDWKRDQAYADVPPERDAERR